jgi:hypothetical protein
LSRPPNNRQRDQHDHNRISHRSSHPSFDPFPLFHQHRQPLEHQSQHACRLPGLHQVHIQGIEGRSDLGQPAGKRAAATNPIREGFKRSPKPGIPLLSRKRIDRPHQRHARLHQRRQLAGEGRQLPRPD